MISWAHTKEMVANASGRAESFTPVTASEWPGIMPVHLPGHGQCKVKVMLKWYLPAIWTECYWYDSLSMAGYCAGTPCDGPYAEYGLRQVDNVQDFLRLLQGPRVQCANQGICHLLVIHKEGVGHHILLAEINNTCYNSPFVKYSTLRSFYSGLIIKVCRLRRKTFLFLLCFLLFLFFLIFLYSKFSPTISPLFLNRSRSNLAGS